MADERVDREEAGDDEPFDANPPVEPSEPQVGNSKARFFMPRDEDEGSAREELASQRGENAEGES